MRSQRDQFIHELESKTIVTLLKKSAWKFDHQTLTSAATNDNALAEPQLEWMEKGENTAGINAFLDIQFDHHVKRILDVGGGKYDCNRHYLQRERNITLSVWDPYNRTQHHNARIQAEVVEKKVDAVTSMSVLNVISEVAVRLAHISTLKAALRQGGKAYFKIWAGEGLLQGTYLPSATEVDYQANAFADRFLREVEIVFGRNNVIIDQSIPNLIIAIKLTENITSFNEILHLKQQSAREAITFTSRKEKSMRDLYAKHAIRKLFSKNLTFFKKTEDEYIEENRYSDSMLQQAYDQRYGLVPCKKSF